MPRYMELVSVSVEVDSGGLETRLDEMQQKLDEIESLDRDEVESMITQAVDDIDVSDKVEEAIGEHDFSSEVEAAIGDEIDRRSLVSRDDFEPGDFEDRLAALEGNQNQDPEAVRVLELRLDELIQREGDMVNRLTRVEHANGQAVTFFEMLRRAVEILLDGRK